MLLLTLAIVAATAAPARARAPKPAVVTISDALIAEIQAHARSARAHFLGVLELDGDTSRVYVSSTRQSIASKTAKAAERGGRYTPPTDGRQDLLLVLCGDADLGERFDCSRVRVIAPGGKEVRAATYNA